MEPRAPKAGPNWPAILTWIITTLAAATAAWLHGNSCGCTVPRFEAPAEEQISAPLALDAVCGDATGWLGPRQDLPRPACPRFADTPAGRDQAQADDDPDVYLWLAAVKATGKVLPARQQGSVGACVGFGTTCALEYLACMQVTSGRLEKFADQVQESLYGLSRVQVGGGRVRGDGSLGVWAAEAAKRYGVLARAPGYDTYDETRCRAWGRSGPPKELLALIEQHPCRDYAQCLSAADCRAALRAGYPIAVSSSQGFVKARDPDGFAKPRGTWRHCMAIIGYRSGNRTGFYVENSWGPDWIAGPNFPPPSDAAAPPEGGFWADWSVVDRMARQGDTFAFSDLVGFPTANPWVVQRHTRGACCRRLRLPGLELLRAL